MQAIVKFPVAILLAVLLAVIIALVLATPSVLAKERRAGAVRTCAR